MINQTAAEEARPLFLTRKQLATRWACCPATIARNKAIRPVFIGDSLRYALSDIVAVETAALASKGGAQ